jgi:hypothetical protein
LRTCLDLCDRISLHYRSPSCIATHFSIPALRETELQQNEIKFQASTSDLEYVMNVYPAESGAITGCDELKIWQKQISVPDAEAKHLTRARRSKAVVTPLSRPSLATASTWDDAHSLPRSGVAPRTCMTFRLRVLRRRGTASRCTSYDVSYRTGAASVHVLAAARFLSFVSPPAAILRLHPYPDGLIGGCEIVVVKGTCQ